MHTAKGLIRCLGARMVKEGWLPQLTIPAKPSRFYQAIEIGPDGEPREKIPGARDKEGPP